MSRTINVVSVSNLVNTLTESEMEVNQSCHTIEYLSILGFQFKKTKRFYVKHDNMWRRRVSFFAFDEVSIELNKRLDILVADFIKYKSHDKCCGL